MTSVIQMQAHPRLLQIVRIAINQRAAAVSAPEPLRLRALAQGLAAIREGRSTGSAIALGNAVMPRPRRVFAVGPAPEAA